MFADVVMMPEMTPDGSGFRVNTRLARFSNIPELSAMLSQFMILRRFKDVNGQVDRPDLYCDKPTAVKIPGSRQLKEYVKILAERAEEIRGGQVDPRDDNMLEGGWRRKKGGARLAVGYPRHGRYPIVEDQYLYPEHCGNLPSHRGTQVSTDRILRSGYTQTAQR